MSAKRYSDEFKAEAVRFVLEQGHTTREVAARRGVSEHSFYRWVREARPPGEEQHASDLVEAQKEIRSLNRENCPKAGTSVHDKWKPD